MGDRIEKFLTALKVPVYLKGFAQIKRLVELHLEEPNARLHGLTEKVATERGEKYDTVERDMRYAVEIFNQRKKTLSSKNIAIYFEEKMTIKKFVKTVVYCLEHNLDKAVCDKL